MSNRYFADFNMTQAPYKLHGTFKNVIYDKSPEIITDGAAGTGKTRFWLEKLHICANKYDRCRIAIIRKTRQSITQSIQVTYEKKVLPEGHLGNTIKFRTAEQEYRYPNGSIISIGGMDKTSKIMSSEYDIIYVPEATELTEEEWEHLGTRIRNGVIPYQQIVGDCNPSHEKHWILQRNFRGILKLHHTRHEDNPSVTQAYLNMLDNLTGLRYKRLRLGLWVSSEGLVYEDYDPKIHVIKRFTPPVEWERFWALDFGYTAPFVWGEWIVDPEGRLILHRQIYKTKRLVEDLARDIKGITKGDPKPAYIVCDHDAEGRATLEKHLGIPQGSTTPAYKKITDGIQAVQARFKLQDDGEPRILFMEGSLLDRDTSLDEKRLPASLEEEILDYTWDMRAGKQKGEIPMQDNDHGMDMMRYAVASRDCKPVGSRGIFF